MVRLCTYVRYNMQTYVHTVLRISIDLLYDSYSIVLLYVIDGQKRRACLLLLVS